MSHSAVSVIENPTRQVLRGAVVGDRFHPTDQELVDYYLRRYVSDSGYEGNELPIAEVNVYKFEPCELPGLSKIVSDDQEWYFISPIEFMDKKKKRFNRKTKTGTWKPTGNPRKVLEKGSKKEIGSKRTLVFHEKNAKTERVMHEKNAKTEWVMHEYQYTLDSDLPNAGEFVVIKLKRKPGEKSKKSKLNCVFNGNCDDENQCESANSACHDGEFVSSELGSHNHDAMSTYDLDEPSWGMASSCNPGEFVIIKLMNSVGEMLMATKMSKQNFKKKSTSPYGQNQSLDEVMITSDCCSHEVPADFGSQNAENMAAMSTYSIPQQSYQMVSAHKVMAIASCCGHHAVPADFEYQNIVEITAMSTYDGGEPSSQATSSYQNQSSISKVRKGGYFPTGVSSLILENEEENEQSNRLLASDSENQLLPTEVEDSPSKETPCTGNQLTQHKINPGCLVTSRFEDDFQNKEIDKSLDDDDDFWSSLKESNVNVANETFLAVDLVELIAEWDELQCPLNPAVQQTACAEQCK